MWDWIPGVRVGAFVFGQPLPAALPVSLRRLPASDDGTDWLSYEVGEHLARVEVEAGLVVAVECFQSLTLRGHELLRRSIAEALQILPDVARLAERYGGGDERWECDALGLMLWCEQGVVTSASLSTITTAQE
ncbi:MAG: hypothetical protein Tsb0020_34740 [Haliangiales bacterium]